MAQFLKKLFSRDTTEYLRLTNHLVDEICNKKTIKITDEMLKKAFDIEITKNNRPKWVKRFHQKCEKLVRLFQDSNYVSDIHSTIFDIIPKEIKDKNKSSEILMNIVAYCISMGLSWSYYILAFPSGQKIFRDVFDPEKITRAKALINIFALLMTIYITSGYDDLIFRENFFSFLPTIKNVAQDQAWYQAFMAKVQSLALAQITTKAFLAFFQKFVFTEVIEKEEKEE